MHLEVRHLLGGRPLLERGAYFNVDTQSYDAASFFFFNRSKLNLVAEIQASGINPNLVTQTQFNS